MKDDKKEKKNTNEPKKEAPLGKNPKDRFVSDGVGATIKFIPKKKQG